MSEATDPIEGLVRGLLKELGEDPGRNGLEKTPDRVARALRFFTSGHESDPAAILTEALFDVDYDEMVLVRDMEFYSLCEHHMVPFFGRVHVAYIPRGRIVGLSKIPRVVEVFSRRLQVQERLTMEIAGVFEQALKPLGVAVVIEAVHLCMRMRGVEQQNSYAVTSAMKGAFERDPKTRAEFMNLIRQGREAFA